MFLQTITTSAALLSVGASGFLLPPGVSSTYESVFGSEAGIPSGAEEGHTFITLPCRRCTFAVGKVGIEHIRGPKAHHMKQHDLRLDFSLSDDGKFLQVGGESIYPRPTIETFYGRPRLATAHQVEAGAVEVSSASAVPVSVTGYELETSRFAASPEVDDTMVILNYQVLNVEDRNMNLQPIQIVLSTTAKGELSIKNVQLLDSPEKDMPPFRLGQPHSHVVDDRHSHRCRLLPDSLCQLVNTVEGKLIGPPKPGPRPCKGLKDAKEHPRPGHHGLDQHHGPPRPPHGKPHGPPHHHRHHGRHGIMRAMFRGFIAALIPIMLGIFVGMTVSLVGVVVGRIVSFLWISVIRGGRRGYNSVALDEPSHDLVEEGAGHDNSDMPPAYEDAQNQFDEKKEKEEKQEK